MMGARRHAFASMGRRAAALAACMALTLGLSPYAPARADEAASQAPAAQEAPAASEPAGTSAAQEDPAAGTGQAATDAQQDPTSGTEQAAAGGQQAATTAEATPNAAAATATGAASGSTSPATAQAAQGAASASGAAAQAQASTSTTTSTTVQTAPTGAQPASLTAQSATVPAGAQASGTCGECTWYITSATAATDPGQLVIAPTTGTSGTLAGSEHPWTDHASAIKSVRVESGVVAAGHSEMLFRDLSNCTAMDLGGLDTSAVQEMISMFYNCSSLQTLSLPNAFKTSSVIDMTAMFAGCSSLQTLSLPDTFKTSAVQYMSSMFAGCSSLQTLDLPASFDTSYVSHMRLMFFNCSSLQTLDLPDTFKTSSAQHMQNMFSGCTALRTFVVEGSGFTFRGVVTDPRDYAILPDPLSASPYDGTWTKDGGVHKYTSLQMQSSLTGSELAGTWVWTADIVAEAADWSGTYDGSGHTGSVNVQDPSTGYAIQYGTDGSTFPLDQAPLYSEVGTYRTFYRVAKTGRVTKTGSFLTTVLARDASAATLSAEDQVYTGSALAPAPTVTLDVGGTVRTLVAGTDYDVAYADNTDVGTARYSIAFKGNYRGTATGTFAIAPKAVTVTADDETKACGAADPALTATVSGTLGADTVAYTLSREAGEDAGAYAITPTGAATQGNYAVTYKAGVLTVLPAAVQTRTFVIDGVEVTATLTGSSKSIDGLVVARRASASDAIASALGTRTLQGDWDVCFTDGTTEGFGTLTLAFPATGGTVQVWEVHSGTLTKGGDQAVANGTASATVTTLSEFAVTSAAASGSTSAATSASTTAATAAKAATPAKAIPGTGDGSGGALAALLLVAAGAALAALAARRKRAL